MTTVAIIPARGGSKRIPRKNVRDFCGKPMIAWSIEAAEQSGCFDRIVVSTDDAEIAKIACAWGAETPFVRPEDLSDDRTGTRPVVCHAIRQLQESGVQPDLVCMLYATAPFVRPQDLKKGLEVLTASDRAFAFTVASFDYPIQRALRMLPGGGVEMIYPEHAESRSQDLEDACHDAGQFYWGRTQAFLQDLPLFSHHSIAIPVPRHRAQDIDTLEDWRRAELLVRLMESE